MMTLDQTPHKMEGPLSCIGVRCDTSDRRAYVALEDKDQKATGFYMNAECAYLFTPLGHAAGPVSFSQLVTECMTSRAKLFVTMSMRGARDESRELFLYDAVRLEVWEKAP